MRLEIQHKKTVWLLEFCPGKPGKDLENQENEISWKFQENEEMSRSPGQNTITWKSRRSLHAVRFIFCPWKTRKKGNCGCGQEICLPTPWKPHNFVQNA
jgi:hypothetical protein